MPSMNTTPGVLFLYLALVNVVSSTTGYSGDGTCDTMAGPNYQDNGTYVCCNATLIPNNTGKKASCCGEVLYQQDTQMCCNGTVYDGVKEQECCGKDRFNVKYEVCPSNKLLIRGDLELCANEYYHSGFRMCCGQNTYPIDDHVQCYGVHVHDTRTGTCINGMIVDLLMECCGSSKMNSRDQLCCDGGYGEYFPVDKDKPDNDRCCKTDGRPYSSETHHCGPEGVERRHLLISLCGRQAYDPVRDLCCKEFVYKGGKARRLQCQDIISPASHGPVEVISRLACPGQCSILTISEVLQVYRCPFHALIAKRIRKSKHKSGGHRRYLVTYDLMSPEKVSSHEQRIFKFAQNCKLCLPGLRRVIVVVKDLSASINTFSIMKNTKTNRKYLRKMCTY